MRNPEQFDAFYADTRRRMLLGAYALTGDLRAAKAAVRDAYAIAWHHWPKVDRSGEADAWEAWLRPVAWQHAHRRHTARLWHRERSITDEQRATLDALGKLGYLHRRVLLLAHLAVVSLPDMAREVGQTTPETERLLQSATTEFSLHRQIPSTATPQALRDLATVTDAEAWPRVTRVRRAGDARRRTHTAVGVVAAVAVTVTAGVVLTDPSGAQPRLDRVGESVAGVAPLAERGEGDDGDDLPVLTDDALLDVSIAREVFAGPAWKVAETHTNAEGDGRALPCQASRFPDPQADNALVRELHSAAQGKTGPRTVLTMVERSRSDAGARRGFEAASSWYSDCAQERTQLLSVWRLSGAGDEGLQFALRDSTGPGHLLVADVVRTGRYLAVTVSRRAGSSPLAPAGHAELAAASATALCALPGAGACGSQKPRLRRTDPPPAGARPALLRDSDLPPVGSLKKPWVGSDPSRAQATNPAATQCDRTSFRGAVDGAAIKAARTRTFLIPGAKLPVEFGLAESTGQLPAKAAAGFVDRIRSRMGNCADRELGADVTSLLDEGRGDAEVSAWRVATEVSEKRTVDYFMAVGRYGDTVFQVGFIPAPGATMTPADFGAVARRALARARSAAVAEQAAQKSAGQGASDGTDNQRG
ncbi:SigE family RNA polymerase sigma factor [Nocardioides acrostichi]|uniref:DNA-directed RNA polymerase specialized sigma24 family protein n=1 Tax=Nocardioides acrostichi TaxID=2784339 RepID=A0A930UX45_9ACTN|nr:hypothetical protein [Nocardioides acrostichi]MBF4161741.1 hypothetical protein [Nocardioides acrostichi]